MSAPARDRLPWRRQARRERIVWRCGGAELGFYLQVGFGPHDGPREIGIVALRAEWCLGRPLEIFLRPRGPAGGMLSDYADDCGEMLSLLLQHGHTLPALRHRFKPGSLARCAVERAWILSVAEGAIVDPLPADLKPETSHAAR